jgi:hypothetical protein
MSKGIQHKLLNYETAPPAGVWEKIAEALDESGISYEFQSKLLNAEVNPPPTAWKKIEHALSAESISENNKGRVIPWFRYAAAAAIAAMLLLGGIQLFRNNGTKVNGSNSVVVSTPDPVKQTPSVDITVPVTNTITDEQRDDAALEASKHTMASLEVSVSNRIKKSTRHHIAQPIALSSFQATDLNPQEMYQDIPCNEVDPPSVMHSDRRDNLKYRYITLMTPDGNIIRMSKKWSNMLCCVAGEDQDDDCRNQLKKWRDKLAGSALAPSANFLDMLNLVNSLQEGNH